MNKYVPNNYVAYFGWRGIDILTQTQTEGELMYMTQIIAKNGTAIDVKCYMSKMSKFIWLKGNYMLIHEAVITDKLIIGMEFSTTTPCVGLDPIPETTPNCEYPIAFSVPTTHLRYFSSIKAIKLSRNDILSKKIDIRIAPKVVDADNIKLDVYSGYGGMVT